MESEEVWTAYIFNSHFLYYQKTYTISYFYAYGLRPAEVSDEANAIFTYN